MMPLLAFAVRSALAFVARLITTVSRRIAAERARQSRARLLGSLRYHDARLLNDIGLMQSPRNGVITGLTPLDWADLPPHHPLEEDDAPLALRSPRRTGAPAPRRPFSHSAWPSSAST